MTELKYTLRYSKKAQYLQLRLSPKGLEVIVPHKLALSKHKICRFLEEKKSWIGKHAHAYAASAQEALPEIIKLEAVQQSWQVNYQPVQTPKVRLFIGLERSLTLLGDVNNRALCCKLLRVWLKQQAEHYLPARLALLANKTQLPFKNVFIRNNSTRFGSCNNKKEISLCCKLLFLPEFLVDHVLLHELCHTKHLNHGVAFWKLLLTHDTHAKKNAFLLKAAARRSPYWANRSSL